MPDDFARRLSALLDESEKPAPEPENEAAEPDPWDGYKQQIAAMVQPKE